MFFLSALLILFVTPCWMEYVDPKKTYFNFDDDNDLPATYDNDEYDIIEKYSLCYDKYDLCVREKRALWLELLPLLRLLDANTDLNSEEQMLTLELTLSRIDLNSIQNLLQSEKLQNQDFKLFSKFRIRPNWKRLLIDSVTNWIFIHQDKVTMLAIILLLFLLLMYWVYVSKAWYFAGLKMFALFFIASIVTTSYRRYQEEYAKKFVKLKTGIPVQCRPEEMTWYEHTWYFFRGMHSVMPDECLEYYRAELIDPFVESTVVEAVSETFAKLILTPLPLLFEYIGKGLVKLFQVLPWYLWLPVSIAVPFTMCVFLLIIKKYCIRTPFISLEPYEPAPATQPCIHDSQRTPPIQNTYNLTLPQTSDLRIEGGGESVLMVTASTRTQNIVRDRIENLPGEMGDGANNDSCEYGTETTPKPSSFDDEVKDSAKNGTGELRTPVTETDPRTSVTETNPRTPVTETDPLR